MGLSVEPIHITGLRELQAALKQLDGESQKQLRVVLNSAAETVAGGARRRVPTRTGKAKGSIRVMSTQREARVAEGGKKAPYMPWLDYGGTVGRGRTGRGGVASAAGRSDAGTAGNVKRPFIKAGRYVYPTYHANKVSIQKSLQDSLIAMVESVGIEVE